MKKTLNKAGWEILEFIKEGAELAATIAFTPYGKLRIRPATYYRTLRQLNEKGLVKQIRRGRVNFFSISPAGRKLLNQRAQRIRRTDGFSTVVIFDIPEEQARQRTLFRRYLRQNGFALLQKSVFISSDQPVEMLKEVVGELGLKNFVTLIEGKISQKF